MVMHDILNIGADVFDYIAHQHAPTEKLIARPKAQHNKKSYTGCLPPEVLAAIFEWNAEMQKYNVDPIWMEVAHVCSQWRRVALHWRSFWCCVPIHVRSCRLPMKEIFRRAKTLPLSIVLDSVVQSPSSGRYQKEIDFIFSNVHRVRDLTILSESVVKEKLLDGPIPITTLTALRIQNFYAGRISKIVYFWGSNAPRLRLLELEGSFIPKNPPLLPTLTTLILRNLAMQLVLVNVVNMLVSMPNLENLILDNINKQAAAWERFVASTSRAPPRHTPKVRLPRLQRLDMIDDLENCNDILSHLVYPSTALVCVTAYLSHLPPYNTPDPDPECILQLAAVKDLGDIIGERCEPIQCMSLVSGSTTLLIKTWCHVDPSLVLPSDRTPLNLIEFRLRSAEKITATANGVMLKTFLRSLRLENLESLHLYDVLMKSGSWKVIFADVPTLKCVNISGYVPNFIGAVYGTSRRPSTKMKFESLRHLATQMPMMDTWTLEDCLRERFGENLSLHELHLVVFGLNEETIERIRGFVNHLYLPY